MSPVAAELIRVRLPAVDGVKETLPQSAAFRQQILRLSLAGSAFQSVLDDHIDQL